MHPRWFEHDKQQTWFIVLFVVSTGSGFKDAHVLQTKLIFPKHPYDMLMKLFPTYKIKSHLDGSVGGRLTMRERLYLCADKRRERCGKSCGRSRVAVPILCSCFRRTRLAAPLMHRRGSDAALQPLVWTSPTRSGSSGSGETQKRCACLSEFMSMHATELPRSQWPSTISPLAPPT